MNTVTVSAILTAAAIYLAVGVRFADMVDANNRRQHMKHLAEGYPVVVLLWPIFAIFLTSK